MSSLNVSIYFPYNFRIQIIWWIFFFLVLISFFKYFFCLFIDGTTIKSVSENVIGKPGEDATLSCTVEGQPLSAEHVRWERLGYEMSEKTKVTFINGTSYLTIKDAQREDVGNFRCIADNRVANPTSRDVLLIVKCKHFLCFCKLNHSLRGGKHFFVYFLSISQHILSFFFVLVTNSNLILQMDSFVSISLFLPVYRFWFSAHRIISNSCTRNR